MPLKIVRYKITKETERAVKDAWKKLQHIVDMQHDITVIVLPQPIVYTDMGEMVTAVFLWDPRDKKKLENPEILLSGVPVYDFPVEQFPDLIVENLCHEVAHYEQWRDGRKIQERGVQVRAKTLVRKIKEM